ncbi:MAG TPA: sensor histidine kinase [Anaerolineae bacterium]
MIDKTTSLETFLAKAAGILQATESNLQELAQIALLKYQQDLSGQENGRNRSNGDSPLRLDHIARQLSSLSERSKALQIYLQGDLTTPPIDDNDWPRIRILQSQEEERVQTARQLEDSVGQLLANAIFELASCQQLLTSDEEAVYDGLDVLQAELEQGLTNFRQLITEMEPTTILGNFGLGGGIRRYLEQYEAKTGLKTQLRINANFGRLPTVIEIAIFRIIQEALSNVQRHANATQVEVAIDERETMLQFSVIDNGDGIAFESIGKPRRKLGLARISDYAELLNGRLRILSEPGHGTQVTLSIPYPAL